LMSIFRDLARPTPRIENLGVGSYTKVFGVGFATRDQDRTGFPPGFFCTSVSKTCHDAEVPRTGRRSVSVFVTVVRVKNAPKTLGLP